jgi:hypothetical protein
MNNFKNNFTILIISIIYSAISLSSEGAGPYGFIAHKYPESLAQTEQPYEDDSREEYEEAILTAGVDTILQSFQFTIYDHRLFEDQFEAQMTPVMEKDCLLRQNLSTRFKQPFFKIMEKVKLDSRTSIGLDFLLTALQLDYQLRIFVKNKKESVGVVFLGRTPYFYKLLLKEIQKNHPHKYNDLASEGFDFIHLAYSGHPDALSVRDGHLLHDIPKVRAANLLTEERLGHFHNYMQSQKLHKYDRLVIVDMMEKGAGMSRFLTILKDFYKKMNMTYKNPLFMHLTRCPGFTPPQADGVRYTREECMYRFVEDKARNYEPHILPFIEIHASTTSLANCADNDFVQYAACGGMYYPAQRWSPEYDERRDAGGPLKEATEQALIPVIQI